MSIILTTFFRARAGVFPLLLAAFLPFTTGCETVEKYSLTHQVWNNAGADSFSRPATDPNLALFLSTNNSDLLIQYDALRKDQCTITRRIYWAQQNYDRIAAGRKPKWAKHSETNGLAPVVVLTPTLSTTNNVEVPLYAIILDEDRGFTLHGAHDVPIHYPLPVYSETMGTGTRVLLTPLTVVGDTVIAATAATVLGLLVAGNCALYVH